MLSYDSYIVDYFGTMSEDAFARYSRRASVFLSNITSGRSDKERRPEVVDRLNLAIVEIMATMEQEDAPGGGIVSESNDGVSVTYAASKDSRTTAQRCYDIAAQYLASTGLLYRGVRLC